ncbi:threonine dehydrogenase-like Zn-dependent dehydrogenase [Marmoricola sp. URHA0025 HA25]
MSKRPISISHLVFGLIFLGITALWVVGATTDVEAPALALWGPVVLIGAGVVGLAAIVLNSRTARRTALEDREPEYAATVPADDEERS